MWAQSTTVTDRKTDRGTNSDGQKITMTKTALCTASRADARQDVRVLEKESAVFCNFIRF